LVDIVTDDRQGENAMAFAVTCSYPTFSPHCDHHDQDALLLLLQFNGPFNLCQPLEPPVGAATFSLGLINIHVRKTGTSPAASCQTFSWGTISLKPASSADGSFRKVFLDTAPAYIFVASCVANLFHFCNHFVTITCKPHLRLSAMDKVSAIDKINDEKHMLVGKLSLLANCLRLKPGNIFHARLWLEFILPLRMPHADFANSPESSVVHV
jgi:hypothetical protein